MRNRINILFLIVVEFIMINVLVVPLSRGADEFFINMGIIAIMTILTFLVYYFVHGKLKGDHLLLFFGISIVMFFLGWAIGAPPFLALVAAILLFWRTIDVLSGETFNHLWIIFIVTVGAAVVYRLFFHGLPSPYLFIGLILLQALLILTVSMNQSGVNGARNSGSMLAFYLAAAAGFAFIGVMLVFAFPYVYEVFAFILRMVGLVIFYVTQFFFNLLRKFGVGNGESPFNGLDIDKNKQHVEKQMPPPEDHGQYLWFTLALVAVIVIIILFYIRKRRLRLAQGEWTDSSTVTPGFTPKKESGSRFLSRRLKAPKEPVRERLFRMQMALKNKEEERRLPNETLGEWLAKLPIDDDEKTKLASTYEKVRYGEQSINQEELSTYRRMIDAFLSRFKGDRSK
ncbi:DUF4129 domain-containing protein [Camelliibacillus cellulosilyticus]|uniref:DUF4129 domain-containing protein n=1 Tax=Camelliibacillus cellulosilyticus TaxID=2174486 RepID=A0ABV9GL42_9BACL